MEEDICLYNFDSSLQLTDHLTSDNQEAADMLEMLDKVLQTKEVR